MQAIRVVRPRKLLAVPPARCLATASASVGGNGAGAVHVVSHTSTAATSAVPLSNVEAQWERLSAEEQIAVHQQLEEIQKKDWKELSVDEKKAAYYVAFGPHGPRTPPNPPGTTPKIILGTLAMIGVSSAIWAAVKNFSPAPPKTMTKEWQEASNERAKEAKINPISGISSEGYSGKGYVTTK